MNLIINPTRTIKRAIKPDDIAMMSAYGEQRKSIRRLMVDYKRKRRMYVGPYCTMIFENFHTMLYQVHEMLYTEGNTKGQLDDELTAYNPLIPCGNALSVTLMLDMVDTSLRKTFLLQLGGIEETIHLRFEQHDIKASFEQDVERTNEAGKTSSVHFLHFNFNQQQVQDFKQVESASIAIDHSKYSHLAIIPFEVKDAIARDL